MVGDKLRFTNQDGVTQTIIVTKMNGNYIKESLDLPDRELVGWEVDCTVIQLLTGGWKYVPDIAKLLNMYYGR